MEVISLYDIAMKNIRLEQRSYYPANVKIGDIVTVLSPWVEGEDYTGLVVSVSQDNMTLYDNKYNRKITWPKRVKCNILKL